MPSNDFTARITDSLEHLKTELAGFHVGRAMPSLVEDLSIEYYGTHTPLKQLATITSPEAKVLVIQPFDVNASKEIEKAVQASDLGVQPVNEGKSIRIVFPPLTEERRQQIVKGVHQKCEEARVAVRKIREEEIKRLRASEKAGEMSEDQLHAEEESIQMAVTDANGAIAATGQEKEQAIEHI